MEELSRRGFGKLVVGGVAVAALPVAFAETATAGAGKRITFPRAWHSPLGARTLTLNTKYAAYDGDCRNADSRWWARYLDTGLTEHLGVDLDANHNDAVRAIASGRVMRVGTIWGGGSREVVLVEHKTSTGKSFTLAYGHLAAGKNPRTSQKWRPGDLVRARERLGGIRKAGTGNHLHLGLVKGRKNMVHAVHENSNSNCRHVSRGTIDPLRYLADNNRGNIGKSIVGWKNSNGSVTSWQVVKTGGKFRRRWVPDSRTYWCLRNKGFIDWGPMPARFLDQLPDQRGVWASC